MPNVAEPDLRLGFPCPKPGPSHLVSSLGAPTLQRAHFVPEPGVGQQQDLVFHAGEH